jgi:hypothetical protein
MGNLFGILNFGFWIRLPLGCSIQTKLYLTAADAKQCFDARYATDAFWGRCDCFAIFSPIDSILLLEIEVRTQIRPVGTKGI